MGFDTSRRLTEDLAARFRTSGFRFVVRYVQRTRGVVTTPPGEGTGSMSVAEAEAILAGGLALMPVQFAKIGLEPSEQLGASMGDAMAWNLRRLGFPPGVTAWYDAEAIRRGTHHSIMAKHVNAWTREVEAAGYEAGIYVGPSSALTTESLYRDLELTRYWKSASWVPTVNERGYCMMQSLHQEVHGITVDVDVCGIDAKKGRPHWLEPTSCEWSEDERSSGCG